MDILDRICKLLGNGKQQELTDYLGLKKTAFSDWKGGKSNSYRRYLIEIAEFFGVSLDFLVFGKEQPNLADITNDEKELLSLYKELDPQDKGSVLGKAEGLAEAARRRKAELEVSKKEKTEFKSKITLFPEPELTEEEDETEEEYIYLPLSDNPASAGTGMYLDGDYAESVRVRATPEARRSDFAVKVSGDSMEPRFRNGDIVLVSKEPVEIGETGIFVYEGDGYIKQLGEDCLISLNPAYPNIPIKDRDSFFCQGKVVAVLSPNKRRN